MGGDGMGRQKIDEVDGESESESDEEWLLKWKLKKRLSKWILMHNSNYIKLKNL